MVTESTIIEKRSPDMKLQKLIALMVIFAMSGLMACGGGETKKDDMPVETETETKTETPAEETTTETTTETTVEETTTEETTEEAPAEEAPTEAPAE